jgi:Flp pilus assembly pilin Flp
LNLNSPGAGSLRDDDGATAVEYAMMLALILAVIVSAIGWTGLGSETLFDNSNEKMQDSGLGR